VRYGTRSTPAASRRAAGTVSSSTGTKRAKGTAGWAYAVVYAAARRRGGTGVRGGGGERSTRSTKCTRGGEGEVQRGGVSTRSTAWKGGEREEREERKLYHVHVFMGARGNESGRDWRGRDDAGSSDEGSECCIEGDIGSLSCSYIKKALNRKVIFVLSLRLPVSWLLCTEVQVEREQL
jgi:hypothetical protein